MHVFMKLIHEQEYRPSHIQLSSRCNPDIVARLLPDQRDPRIGIDFVTDLKVTENNLAVLSFIDGHVELYDGYVLCEALSFINSR